MTSWPVLRGLHPRQVDRLIAGSRRRRFLRGEIIFSAGESADGLHLLDHGRAAVRMITAQGDQLITDVLGPGAAFGGPAAAPAPRATVSQITALQPCSTILLRRHQLDEIGDGRHSIETFLVSSLADQVSGLAERLLEILYVPAPERVLRRLLELDAEFGGAIEMTQDEIAMMCGTTRSTVNETLRGLERLGAIEIGRGRVRTLDRGLLEGRGGRAAA